MLKYIVIALLVLGLNVKVQSFPNVDDMYFDWTDVENSEAWTAAGLDVGLVSYWAMRFSGSTIFDEYGTNNITKYGNILLGTNYGKVADGAKATVGTDNIYGAVPVTTYPFTLAAWFSMDSTNVGGLITMQTAGTTDNNYHALYADKNAAYIVSRSAVPAVNVSKGGTTALSTGVWYHIAGVWESATDKKLYLNGVLEATLTNSVAHNSPSRIVITDFRQSTIVPYNGKIDECVLWSRALTSNEVYQLYSQPLYKP